MKGSEKIAARRERSEEKEKVREPVAVSVARKKLDAVLADPEHMALDVLDAFPELQKIYDKDAATIEGYSLRQHTLMVLRQFEKYFANAKFPENVDAHFMEVILALHDIGKPQAAETGDVKKQHDYTSAMMRSLLSQLAYSPEQINVAIALVDGDPIRKFLYPHPNDPQDVAERICEKARLANMSPEDFFDLLTIYFQSDAGSYTVNAGGKASLDRMFIFEPSEGRMSFAPRVEEKIQALKRLILETAAKENKPV